MSEEIIHKKCGKRIEGCKCKDTRIIMLTVRQIKRIERRERIKKAFKKMSTKIKETLKDPVKREKIKNAAKKVLCIVSGGRIKL